MSKIQLNTSTTFCRTFSKKPFSPYAINYNHNICYIQNIISVYINRCIDRSLIKCYQIENLYFDIFMGTWTFMYIAAFSNARWSSTLFSSMLCINLWNSCICSHPTSTWLITFSCLPIVPFTVNYVNKFNSKSCSRLVIEVIFCNCKAIFQLATSYLGTDLYYTPQLL